jgi:hypothetical protein
MQIDEIKNKIKRVLSETPWFLAKRAFFVFLAFVLIVLIVGAILLYQYSWKIERKEIKTEVRQIQINENIYNQFLKNYSQRELNYRKVDEETYPDIFFRR